MTDKAKLEEIKKLADAMYYAAFNLTTNARLLRKAMDDYHQFLIYEHHKEEPVSEEFEKAANTYVDNWYKLNNLDKESYPIDVEISKNDFKAGAKWQKEHPWKHADGDDLPIFDREVIVLTQPYPLEGNEYAVSFAHRPNPDGRDGKSLTSGKIEHYTPKTFDKGGWNQPNVKWWLDCLMPKKIEWLRNKSQKGE